MSRRKAASERQAGTIPSPFEQGPAQTAKTPQVPRPETLASAAGPEGSGVPLALGGGTERGRAAPLLSHWAEPGPSSVGATPLRRRASPQAAFAEATAGGGAPVPFQADMERSFGADLSGVRAHLGRASEMEALDARAAARDDTVAFADSSPDRALVAHEIAHVLQARLQGGGGVQGKSLSRPDCAAEREADELGARVAAGERVEAREAPSAGIHLANKGTKASNTKAHLEEWLKEIKGRLKGVRSDLGCDGMFVTVDGKKLIEVAVAWYGTEALSLGETTIWVLWNVDLDEQTEKLLEMVRKLCDSVPLPPSTSSPTPEADTVTSGAAEDKSPPPSMSTSSPTPEADIVTSGAAEDKTPKKAPTDASKDRWQLSLPDYFIIHGQRIRPTWTGEEILLRNTARPGQEMSLKVRKRGYAIMRKRAVFYNEAQSTLDIAEDGPGVIYDPSLLAHALSEAWFPKFPEPEGDDWYKLEKRGAGAKPVPLEGMVRERARVRSAAGGADLSGDKVPENARAIAHELDEAGRNARLTKAITARISTLEKRLRPWADEKEEKEEKGVEGPKWSLDEDIEFASAYPETTVKEITEIVRQSWMRICKLVDPKVMALVPSCRVAVRDNMNGQNRAEYHNRHRCIDMQAPSDLGSAHPLIVHEFVHHLEYYLPSSVWASAVALLQHRSGDKPLVAAAEGVGTKDPLYDCAAGVDAYSRSYCSDDGGTELLSRVSEILMREGVKRAAEDPSALLLLLRTLQPSLAREIAKEAGIDLKIPETML